MIDPSGIVELRKNDAEGRYEAELADGAVATIDYRVEGGRMHVDSTFTPEKHRQRGIAGRLTRFMLDEAVERDLKVVPHCPYTAWFIRENPKYAAHVASEVDL